MHRCARREIDQIISLNRGRVRFQPSRKLQRMSIIPVVRGIFLTRRRSNYCAGQNLPFSLFLLHTESDASILQTFGEYVGTRRRGKTIDHWGIRGLSTFYRVALKKNCSRGKVSWNLGSEQRRTFFSLRLSMHRLSRELLGERSNPLNKD